jgi:hypothetical protein
VASLWRLSVFKLICVMQPFLHELRNTIYAFDTYAFFLLTAIRPHLYIGGRSERTVSQNVQDDDKVENKTVIRGRKKQRISVHVA